MPDSRARLEEAIRYERAGALEKAAAEYRALAADGDAAIRSEALRHMSDVHRTRCEWPQAIEAARESARIAESQGMTELYAEGLNAEAAVYQARGELEVAVPLLERMLEIARDERVRGIAFQNLGYVAAMRGAVSRAREHFDASVECFRRAGYDRGIVIALANHARAAIDEGDPVKGRELAERASQRARELGDLELLASAMINEAEALAELDRMDEAVERASAALGYLVTVGNVWKQIECFRLLGRVHERRGDIEVTRRCYEQGRDLAARIDARLEAGQLEALLRELEG